MRVGKVKKDLLNNFECLDDSTQSHCFEAKILKHNFKKSSARIIFVKFHEKEKKSKEIN